MTGKDLGWLFLWITLLVIMGMGTWSIRQRLLQHYSETDAAVRWQEWKKATEAMAVDIGPTSRTPVSTELPPSYTLLRDHFAACLAGVVVTSGVFFGVVLWMLRGVLASPAILPK